MIIDVMRIIYDFANNCTKNVLAIAYPKIFTYQGLLCCNLAKKAYVKTTGFNSYKYNGLVHDFRCNHDNILLEADVLDIMTWAIKNSYKLNEIVCEDAAINNHSRVIKLAYKNGYKLNKSVVNYFASWGNLEMVIWARNNNCYWDQNFCVFAINHLNIVEWAIVNGAKLSPLIIDKLAKIGNLDLIKLAINYGCEWSYQACETAAKSGHLQIVK